MPRLYGILILVLASFFAGFSAFPGVAHSEDIVLMSGWPWTAEELDEMIKEWQALPPEFDLLKADQLQSYDPLPAFPFDLVDLERKLRGQMVGRTDCDAVLNIPREFGPWLRSPEIAALPDRCDYKVYDYFAQLPEYSLYCDPKYERQAVCGGSPAAPITVASASGSTASSKGNGGFDNKKKDPSSSYVFPSVVALTSNKSAADCTGTIVGKSTVLTAAHCVCDSVPTFAFIGTSMSQKSATAKGLQEFRPLTGETVIFKDYCTRRGGNDPDIVDLALLYLKSEVKPYFVAPLDWDGVNASFGVFVGFGVSEDSNGGGTKRYGLSSFKPCIDPEITKCLLPWEYLSDMREGHADTCFGDSGGPVFSEGRVVGVTSRQIGGGRSEYCGSGGVYVALTRYFNSTRAEEIAEWFRNNIK